MVTKTRCYQPGSIHLLGRRTTQRKHLLRPDPLLVQNALYLLGYQQERYEIEIHDVIFMSTHPHLLVTDVHGDSIPGFNRDFNSLFARSTNCLRGRWENLWSSDKPSSVEICPTAEDILDKWPYLRVNAVEAGLVSHSKKWPGVHVPPLFLGDWKVTTPRPDFFYNPKGSMPEETTLIITTPTVWDASPEELRLRVAQECNRREREIREEFRRKKRTFLGAKRVLRVSPESSPKTREPRRNLNPHVACKDPKLRQAFLQWKAHRQARYDRCRELLLNGTKEVVFPEGTWALKFLYGLEREPWSGCIWKALAYDDT